MFTITRRLSQVLPVIKDIVVYTGLPLLLLMFMHFNIEVAQQTKATSAVVVGQTKILNAIRDATNDNRLTAEKKSNLILCMLQIPLDQRTDTALQGCRKQAETTPVAVTSDSTSQTPSNSVDTSPSTQSTTPVATTQPDNSQGTKPAPQPTVTQRILNFINPFN